MDCRTRIAEVNVGEELGSTVVVQVSNGCGGFSADDNRIRESKPKS